MRAAPPVVRTRAELALARQRLTGRVAVVMTMGALHRGHAALMKVAHEHADAVIVTIFVNPLQFGAGEDFDRYPRTMQDDLDICAAEGVALVFAPDRSEMYPYGDPAVRVDAGELGRRLEGASRPGHFDGVVTVVAKLLSLIRPDVAVFGEKDAQQLALIRAMVRDLDLGVEIVGGATVREADGLALSSRNRYLSPDERARASALNEGLRAGAAAAPAGAAAVRCAAQETLATRHVEPDYLVVVDEASFTEVDGDFAGPARILVAARIGSTRLIDNVGVFLGTREG